MEKRVLIAVILSIAVMYGYSIIFPPPKQLPIEKVQNSAEPQQAGSVSVKNLPLLAEVPATAAVKSVTNAKDVTVENDVFSAEFSAMGGALKKLTLKHYKDKAGSAGKDITLINESSQDLFTFSSEYPGFTSSPVQYTVSSSNISLTGSEKKSIDFSLVTPAGIHLIKRFTFSGSSYAITLDNIIQNRSVSVQDGSLLTILRNHSVKPTEEAGRYEVFGPAIFSESSVTFGSISDLQKAEKTYNKSIKWTGFGDKYFLDAVMSKDNSINSVTMKDSNGVLAQQISSPRVSLNPGSETIISYNLYIGPKDLNLLKAEGENLEGAIDLGWFAIIAKPLLHAINLFYGYLHNYGLAIILITVILKILFFPLTNKSYKSMKEMQKLQPKMQELKEKFKDDKDGLNRSVMELYKTHKVNPLGGCLPMIVQIPVFFGLYKALMFSVELRHAPFYFWLQDLSAKDPYYITPIVMGATMFIQQKMTPTNMDPMQAKMMLALPVVFTAMFLNFPSGLVLYWLVNNILTIAQQMYINKSLEEA